MNCGTHCWRMLCKLSLELEKDYANSCVIRPSTAFSPRGLPSGGCRRHSNEQQKGCPFFKVFPCAFAAASLETAPGPELWRLVWVRPTGQVTIPYRDIN